MLGLRDAINTLVNSDNDDDKTDQIPNIETPILDLLPIEENHINTSNEKNSLFKDNIEVDKNAEAWDWVGRGNVMTESYSNSTNKPNEKNKKDSVHIKPFIQSWEISNASNGGYCLKSDNTTDYQSQVGDIILLRRENYPNEPWRLGIVRWMQSLSDRGVKIGIETLLGNIQPAKVIDAHFSLNKFKGLDHILHLTEKSAAGKTISLIAPPNSIKAGESLEIQVDGQKQTIVFEAAIDRTISFVRFTYLTQQS